MTTAMRLARYEVIGSDVFKGGALGDCPQRVSGAYLSSQKAPKRVLLLFDS